LVSKPPVNKLVELPRENRSSNILTPYDKGSGPIQENEGANANSDYNDDSFDPLSSEIKEYIIHHSDGSDDNDYSDDTFESLHTSYGEIQDNVNTGIDHGDRKGNNLFSQGPIQEDIQTPEDVYSSDFVLSNPSIHDSVDPVVEGEGNNLFSQRSIQEDIQTPEDVYSSDFVLSNPSIHDSVDPVIDGEGNNLFSQRSIQEDIQTPEDVYSSDFVLSNPSIHDSAPPGVDDSVDRDIHDSVDTDIYDSVIPGIDDNVKPVVDDNVKPGIGDDDDDVKSIPEIILPETDILPEMRTNQEAQSNLPRRKRRRRRRTQSGTRKTQGKRGKRGKRVETLGFSLNENFQNNRKKLDKEIEKRKKKGHSIENINNWVNKHELGKRNLRGEKYGLYNQRLKKALGNKI
jgi:hypothetical protein